MQKLNRYLRKGENVLWESAPESFPLFEGRMKLRILGEWIVTILFAVWLFYVERGQPGFGTGVKTLVVLVAAAIILSPVVEYKSLQKQAYYLTDQRAILFTGDKTFYYMDYNKIDDCRVLKDIAQGGCIAMGGCIMEDVSRQLRWQACHPKIDLQEANHNGESLGMVFYLPAGLKEMVQLMRENGVKVDL